jgi:hypothetical protein
MPLELGLSLGARRYGPRLQREKRCIIFDREQYRYQRYISDIAGQDIHAHGGDETTLIGELAAWLRTQSGARNIPGGRAIATEYGAFRSALPAIWAARGLHTDEITFADYADIVVQYLTIEPTPAS